MHQEYFKEEIVPLLDGRRKFIGPVGFERKKRLLSEARCLLITSTIQETSSLVAMEALAAGTPVIAYRTGALPEVIQHGRTGFLVRNVKEMAQAITSIDRIHTEECRRAARRYFSADRMVAQYTQLYRRLIAKTSIEELRTRAAERTSWLVNW